jgi:CDP-diacylglycerol--glycerol-3-phosphate 3-phosphatidyltransferase
VQQTTAQDGRPVRSLGLWTLPNAITWLRVIVAIPVILLIVDGSAWALWTAFVLMVLSEVSDGVDGYLARRTGQVSAVGKILDPMADSLYRISVFTAFAANHWMPIWMFLIIAWRDVSVSYLRVAAEQTIGTMSARWSGKWKAVFQGAAQLMVVLAHAIWGPALSPLVEGVLWTALFVAVVVTGYSLVDYAASLIRGMLK